MLELYELKHKPPFLFNEWLKALSTHHIWKCCDLSLILEGYCKGKKRVDLKVYNLSFLDFVKGKCQLQATLDLEDELKYKCM